MNRYADLVRAERLARGWSVRKAATAGAITDTWWARFEDGDQPLTDGITEAVARAFGWPADWPVSQPSLANPDGGPGVRSPELSEIVALFRELVDRFEALQVSVADAMSGAISTPSEQDRPGGH